MIVLKILAIIFTSLVLYSFALHQLLPLYIASGGRINQLSLWIVMATSFYGYFRIVCWVWLEPLFKMKQNE